MRFIPMEDHEVSSHIFFFRYGITIAEITEPYLSFSGSKECRTQGIETFIYIMVQAGYIHILGQYLPSLSIRTDRHFHAVALIQQFYPEVFSHPVGQRQRLFLSSVNHEILSIGYHTGIGFLIVEKQQSSRVATAQCNFHFRFITFIHGRSQKQTTIGECQCFRRIFSPEGPLQSQFRPAEIIRNLHLPLRLSTFAQPVSFLRRTTPSVGSPFYRFQQGRAPQRMISVGVRMIYHPPVTVHIIDKCPMSL